MAASAPGGLETTATDAVLSTNRADENRFSGSDASQACEARSFECVSAAEKAAHRRAERAAYILIRYGINVILEG